MLFSELCFNGKTLAALRINASKVVQQESFVPKWKWQCY